jgi:acyl-CoA synthetase (AMP-forming)/AMP-acid ligase II
MNLFHLFAKTANELPAEIALIQGEKRIRYGDLLLLIGELAADLADLGVVKGQRIGLRFPNSIAYVALTYAVWKLEAAIVPIPMELKAAEVEEIRRTMRLAGLISHSFGNGTIQRKCRLSGVEYGFSRWEPEPASYAEMEDIAFVRFTSGTTGRRKGVVLRHATIASRIHAVDRALHVRPADTVVWTLSMAHHFVSTIVLFLSRGATVLLMNDWSPSRILEAAERENGTILYAAPFQLGLLAGDTSHRMLSGIRIALSTTVALSDHVHSRFRRRFNLAVGQAYGIIELGLVCINTDQPDEKIGSVGRVLPDYVLEIRNPIKEIAGRYPGGELHFRGPGFFDAYFHPFAPARAILTDGWFNTGDVGWIDDDGFVYLCGRKKDVVNVAGMKVFPREIEEVLGVLPGVTDCRVYGEKHGLQGEILLAEVVARHEEPGALKKTILAHLKARLAPYKIPSEIRFLDEIPRTAVTAKIIRPSQADHIE